VYLIGFLSPSSPSDSRIRFALEPCGKALRELGYVEGQNIGIESRWARGSMIDSPTWRPSWCV